MMLSNIVTELTLKITGGKMYVEARQTHFISGFAKGGGKGGVS